MYAPHPFVHENTGDLLAFLNQYPLGLMVAANAKGETEMALSPFRVLESEEGISLNTHLAAVNPLFRFLPEGAKVQVWFQGPQAYVSSAWYGHANVPTWNYMGVEARGFYRAMTDAELIDELEALTAVHEPLESPVRLNRLPKAMVGGHLPHVRGIRLVGVELKGIFKLSQNRNNEDHRRVVEALRKRGHGQDAALAEAMEKQRM